METVEALKASHQDFFVRDALFGPTFQDLRNAESFYSMKLLIFQISIVNNFVLTEAQLVRGSRNVLSEFQTCSSRHGG
jgi:hypothetical protein